MPELDLTPGILFRIDKTASPTRIIPADIKGVDISAEWFSEAEKTIRLDVSILIANASIKLSDFKVDETAMLDLGFLPFKGGTTIAATMVQTITQVSKNDPANFKPEFKIVGGKIGGAEKLSKAQKREKK